MLFPLYSKLSHKNNTKIEYCRDNPLWLPQTSLTFNQSDSLARVAKKNYGCVLARVATQSFFEILVHFPNWSFYDAMAHAATQSFLFLIDAVAFVF